MTFLGKTLLFVGLAASPLLSATTPLPAELLAQGRVDDAIATLQAAVNAAPNDAESYNLLCRAYFALGNWDRGIPNCERAASLQPGSSRYHLWLGRTFGEK